LGVVLISARETWLDTGGPVRPLLVAIFAWLAEQESIRLSERTSAGLERARRAGIPLGRPKCDSAKLASAANLVAHGFSYRKAAKARGVSDSSLRRWVRQIGSTTPHAPDPRQLKLVR
jgi:putative DNA-invertase from lambdoid prophage Rac